MSAAQVLKKVDPGCYVSRSRRLRISRNNFNFGLNRGADLTDLRKQSIWICCIETKLFGSESDGCTFYAVKMLDLFFHLGSTVSTAKVLQDVDTLRRCCAVGVVMAMFVLMILAAASTVIVMVMMVMMFVPMFMILTAASAVLVVMVMMVMMFVLALMILTATTAMFIVMVMVVVMFMFMILTATAAVLIVVFMVVMFFMRMFCMVMYIMMFVTASAGI